MSRKLPTIIITGASGFIGRYFINVIKDDFIIFAIARRSRDEAGVPYHKNLKWIQWDIANHEYLDEVVKYIKNGDGGADYVLHLAGYYDFNYDDNPEYERTNVIGTRNVLEMSKRVGVIHFIFSSSLTVCKLSQKKKLIDERSSANADFKYSQTKRRGEEMMRVYSSWFKCSVVRLAAVFSDWCEYAPLYKFISTWLANDWDSRFLGGKGESAISYIHIYDLSKLFLAIISKHYSLSSYAIYIASPDGCESHKTLFRLATRDYYGYFIKPILLPKLLTYPGLLLKNILAALRLIEKPFERFWMIRYIDLKLIVNTSLTKKILAWKPTPRYHITRRLLFLLVNLKNHTNEWILKNEAVLKRHAFRPNLIIYDYLLKEKENFMKKVCNHICAYGNRKTFFNYQKMKEGDLHSALSTLFHLLLASVRSGDRSLMIKYIDDIALQRFANGFEAEEVCELLSVFQDIILLELSAVKEFKNLKQEIYDSIGMTIQLAQDEIEDIYEDLKFKLSPEKIAELNDLQREKQHMEMIRQLSEFYQEHPSG